MKITILVVTELLLFSILFIRVSYYFDIIARNLFNMQSDFLNFQYNSLLSLEIDSLLFYYTSQFLEKICLINWHQLYLLTLILVNLKFFTIRT